MPRQGQTGADDPFALHLRRTAHAVNFNLYTILFSVDLASVPTNARPGESPVVGVAASPSIVIRDLASLEDYQACVDLQEEIWGRGFSERVPTAILRVAQKVGGITTGAFSAEGQLLGFVFGLTGVKAGRLVHWSDMLAVRTGARGMRLGEALKHHQRQAVLALGIEVMYWTFDPLVAKNAYLNLMRLGAVVSEYVEDMYGLTGSPIHGALPTDRLVAEWRLTDPPREGPTLTAEYCNATVVNPVGVHGEPRHVACPDAALVRVQVPTDNTEMYAKEPERALAWRLSVRRELGQRLARGWRVVAFDRGVGDSLPAYIVEIR